MTRRVPQERRDAMTQAMDEYEAEGHLAVPATIDVLRDLLADLTDAEAARDQYARMIGDLAAESSRVGDLAAERDALAAKVERVQALHAPRTDYGSRPHVDWCRACEVVWPCPTIRALDESEG